MYDPLRVPKTIFAKSPDAAGSGMVVTSVIGDGDLIPYKLQGLGTYIEGPCMNSSILAFAIPRGKVLKVI